MKKYKVNELTSGPVIKGTTYAKNIRIWGRGNENSKLVCRMKKINDNYKENKRCVLFSNNDYIGSIGYNDLDYNTIYEYQMGYTDTDDNLDWSNIETYKFEINPDQLSFVFGSCRRYMSVFGIRLCGTGESGDVIYKSIIDCRPSFFMSIGDQVYFDSMNSFLRTKNLKDMRKLYRKVRGFKSIKRLMATVPTYEICDDHDHHINNSNKMTRDCEPEVYNNAQKAYIEYQHYMSPNDDGPYWYIFNIKDISFFVFDTRNERDETVEQMIGHEQFVAFRRWINYKRYRLKFVVSTVPVISQNTSDSWFGFPKQQRQILELILEQRNVFILTGDAHCCRYGRYAICENNKLLGEVTEILSSGLVAITHDHGMCINDHNKDGGDFPCVIANSNGLTFITKESSCSHPCPNKPKTLYDKIKFPFMRVIDNVYTQIIIENNRLISNIYNQDGKLLDSSLHYYQNSISKQL